jgi:glycosyltransferase involved in cell wall biosynthesis
MLVPPGDVEALTATLWRVLDDDGLRERLREGARRVRDRLPTWDQQSATMAGALARAMAGDGRIQS